MDLEQLKDIPGFQGVFKAVINSQIKHLIEQLSTHGAAETIILTVNLSDGTLHQQGSKTAKGFLEGRDEMKSQFLSHCLNYHLCGNSISSEGFKNNQQSDKRFTQAGGYLDSLEEVFTQSTRNSDTRISLSSANSWRKHQLPNSNIIASQTILGCVENYSANSVRPNNVSEYSNSVESWHHHKREETGESDSADKVCFMPDNSDIQTAINHSINDTDYTKLENVGRTVDDENSGLGIENQETSVLESDSDQEHSDTQTDFTLIKTEPAEEEETTLQYENTGLSGSGEETVQNMSMESVANDIGFAMNLSNVDMTPVPGLYNDLFTNQRKRKMYSRPRKRPDQKFDCLKCGKSFKTLQNLQVHDRRHLGIRPFSCELCGQRFYQNSHLRTHILTHSGQKPFTCNYCPLKFYTRSNLRVHERTHTGEKPYNCQYCGKTFSQSSSVSSHMMLHHRDLITDNDFDKSGIVPDNSDIQTASDQTETEIDDLVKTESMNGVFQDQNSVHNEESVGLQDKSGVESGQSEEQSNLQTDPSLVKNEPITDADTALQNEAAGISGIGGDEGTNSPAWPISDNLDMSGEAGTGKFDLDLDKSDVIPELYKDILNNQLATPPNCKKRKRPEKRFDCTKCGKSFKSHQNLQVHDRIHLGIRPFSCDICGQRFSQGSHLQTHIRIHTGEKPYACNLCPLRFYSSSHLRVHERTHTGEKPFSCRYCGKNFTQSSSVTSHIKQHHKNKHKGGQVSEPQDGEAQ